MGAESLQRQPLPAEVFAAMAGEDGVAFLDSSDATHPRSRFSVVAASPRKVITDLDSLDAVAMLPRGACGVDYREGAIGFVGYETGALFERLPGRIPTEPRTPPLCFCSYDALLAYDHARSRWTKRGYRAAGEVAAARLAASPRSGGGTFRVGPVTQQFTRSEYCRRVRTVRRLIRDGEIYQANLTMSFSAPFEGDGAALYLRLRRLNPAPYSAFLRMGGVEVLSFSPELFIRYDGRTIETHPIKGTVRREPGRGGEARRWLRSSAKDRAELAMIVDVERNDLSRMCRSVRVLGHGRIEPFAGLYHTVSTVQGEARGLSPSRILRATFPGGSVTGAPKIRAMEILAELEREERGVYTGAIGYVGRDGSVVFNLAIRTAVIAGGRIRFNAGGGVTWDSVPEREYEEALAKVERLREALDTES